MQITVHTVEAAYELLRTTPPFRGWKLPPADDVEFHVIRAPDRAGDHSVSGDTHCIRISESNIGNLPSLIMVVAHEMVHMQQVRMRPPDRSAHGSRFKTLAARVCRHHLWDLKTF